MSVGFPVWLRNRLISAVLETVLRHTEKSCLALYYRYFLKIIELIPNIIFLYFNIRGKLSIIRCDKQLLNSSTVQNELNSADIDLITFFLFQGPSQLSLHDCRQLLIFFYSETNQLYNQSQSVRTQIRNVRIVLQILNFAC